MSDITRDELLAMLATELEAAQAQLERLGVSLLADRNLAREHVGSLQSLDHVGQRCANIARILRSDDIHLATREATLESISGLLHRDPAGGSKKTASKGTQGDIDWYN